VTPAAKDSKRLSKIIKEEAKAEKQALSVAINELAELQKLQKQAIKVSSSHILLYSILHPHSYPQTEAKAHSAQIKVLSQFQKEERAFLAARTKYDAAQAYLQSEKEALERVRSSARGVTERLQEKSQEVNSLRKTYAVDERERATKLAELAEHSSCCF
jgi:L-rhamnose mutarotase